MGNLPIKVKNTLRRKVTFCDYCKRTGHLSKDCFKRIAKEEECTESGNVVTTEDHIFTSALSMTTNKDSQT
ncbi:hypothetical protein K7432_008380 [Basidiobolus ranarum]|uniref:CCHC-type domain-containing protein n=1 Tax=Basidiobolus ranarum TaxID=34480 RepID=A0ABR2VZL4_9FUNG